MLQGDEDYLFEVVECDDSLLPIRFLLVKMRDLAPPLVIRIVHTRLSSIDHGVHLDNVGAIQLLEVVLNHRLVEIQRHLERELIRPQLGRVREESKDSVGELHLERNRKKLFNKKIKIEGRKE